jgi:hypothetical protein
LRLLALLTTAAAAVLLLLPPAAALLRAGRDVSATYFDLQVGSWVCGVEVVLS